MLIPITIITGFLGSGKTTLLNHLLTQNHGKKIAIIENEFGEKNIDYEFVLHEKEKIYQMSNGCICCSVREDLLITLREIANFKDKLDYILLETTGVADPSPILHSLKQDKEISEKFVIDSIVCLVDLKNIEAQINRSPEVVKQITAANIMLLNKKDLIENEKQFLDINLTLKELNPSAEFFETDFSSIDIDKIFDRKFYDLKKSIPKFIVKIKNEVKHEVGVSSKYFQIEGEISPQYFSIWLDLLFYQCGNDLYRMKGILNFKGETHKVYFQCVHDYVELSKGEPWDSSLRLTEIVAIGKNLDFVLIETGFQNCVK